ncbi:MAG TPA: hypothetical protein VFS07_03595 [Gemmatimonadales bacterium]|jgi:hypothetical protein|nr:hypothetical protein [Gemmatimonadales bacterium]
MTLDPLVLVLLVLGVFALAAGVGVLTARLTLRSAAQQFTSERWWERKADAYSGIVHALHAMRGYVQTLQDLHGGQTVPVAEEHLKVQWRHGREELVRAAAQHAFVVHPDAAQELDRVTGSLRYASNGRPHAEALAGEAEALDGGLRRIREIAARDLR